jgi:hypothetical protein
VSSVSGQATVTGGLAATGTLNTPFDRFSVNPTATVSGGPTFNVATLNTKEFFSGILSPIGLQTIASYMQQGRPLNLLFSLFVAKVTITIDGKSRSFSSNGAGAEFEQFQELAKELQDAGLTTELSYIDQGPAMTMDSIAGLQGSGLELVQSGKGGMSVRLKQPNLVFCFDPRGPAARAGSEINALVTKLMTTRRCDTAPTTVMPLAQLPRSATSITVVPRSTMGVIYRLGEIARTQIGLSDRPCVPTPPATQCDVPMLHRYRNIGGKTVRLDEPLFKMAQGPTSDALSVFYAGHTYSIVADPNAHDHSSEVLQMVLELQALNSSARDLPTPNLINTR